MGKGLYPKGSMGPIGESREPSNGLERCQPPALWNWQNRLELDSQQALQVFPENGLFLLLGNAFQPQYPGNGPAKVHVEGPIGAEDHPASPTASDTAKPFVPGCLDKMPEAGLWFDAPPGRCYTRPYLILI